MEKQKLGQPNGGDILLLRSFGGGRGCWPDPHPSAIPSLEFPDTRLGLDRENGKGHCTYFYFSGSSCESNVYREVLQVLLMSPLLKSFLFF